MAPAAGTTSAVTASVLARTGRTLGEWVPLVEAGALDPVDRKAVRACLRDVHG